jgi:FkbM family methyltransferase
MVLRDRPAVFFIQVGSNDGVQGDPIHDLILLNTGWSGIFIEPVRSVFQQLKRNYREAPRFVFENTAIGKEKEKVKFYYVSEKARTQRGNSLPFWFDQLGSFDRNHILKQLDGRLEPFIIEELIECVPMQEILDRNHVERFDLLHVDTEGFDCQVISQIDFTRYQPKVILYEHHHLSHEERQKVTSLLSSWGYRLSVYDGDTLAILEGK